MPRPLLWLIQHLSPVRLLALSGRPHRRLLRGSAGAVWSVTGNRVPDIGARVRIGAILVRLSWELGTGKMDAFLGLEDNRSISVSDCLACAALITEIDRRAESFARRAELSWQSPHGDVIHRGISPVVTADITSLRRLRLDSFVFSGWRLDNLLADVPVWSWIDQLAEHFPPRGPDDLSEWWLRAFQHYTSDLPDRYVCDAPLVAGEIGYALDGRCVNPDIVGYQERMSILWRSGILERLASKRDPLIVEIGGGYGGLACFIRQVLPHASYCIIDLPSSLKFSACYLSLAGGAPVKIGLPYLAGGYTLVPAGDHFDIDNVDLAINTLSFAEMPAETVADYARFLASSLKVGGALFEQNFDNAHFGLATHCNPAKSIGPHFAGSTVTPGRWLWGTPRFWFPRPLPPPVQ